MARKKAAKAGGATSNAVAFRGSAAWKTWLNRFAASKGMGIVELFDNLLRDAAKRDKFEPPPRRTEGR